MNNSKCTVSKDTDNVKKRGRKPRKGKRAEMDSRGSNKISGRDNLDAIGSNPYNDPAWYFNYPELIESTAKLPFPYKPGMVINKVMHQHGTSDYTSEARIGIPGVMRIFYTPSVGRSQDATDPASQTAKQLFTRVRSAFSSSLAVDAPDLLIQVMALDSIYSYIATLKRVYRTLNTATPQNYSVPDGVLTAMGFTTLQIAQLKQDRIKLLSHINYLIRMINQFICPHDFDVINRHYWMNDNLFADANTQQAQFYMFVEHRYLKFALLNTPDEVPAGGLTLETWSPSLQDASTITTYLLNFGLTLIQALSSWEDCYLINGYFDRAFGSTRFVIEPLQESETLVVSYSEDVLMQITNATYPLADIQTFTLTYNITQNPNTNAVLSVPQYSATKTASTYVADMDQAVMNVPFGQDISAQTVVEASRLTNWYAYNSKSTTTKLVLDIYCATEIVETMRVYYPTRSVDGVINWASTNLAPLVIVSTVDPADITAVDDVALRSWFDWAPAYWFIIDNAGVYQAQFVGDVANITTYSFDQFKEINRMCLLSEFAAFL